jgi:hypothetical protein
MGGDWPHKHCSSRRQISDPLAQRDVRASASLNTSQPATETCVTKSRHVWGEWNSCYFKIILRLTINRNKDSTNGIATRLWAGWQKNRGPIPGRGKLFFFSAQSPYKLWGPRSHYTTGNRGSFPRCNEADTLSWTFTSIYCRSEEWSYTITPPFVFRLWCIIMHWENYSLCVKCE